MSKNFLSKKSWHTGSYKHIKKVWEAERKVEEEEKKIAQLKKEKEEEMKQWELRRLAAESVGKHLTERLDWMYIQKKGPSTEEFLTEGKTWEAEADKKDREDLNKGIFFTQTVNPAQDFAAKIKEDPLLAIKQQEKTVIKNILQNPLKMKKIKSSKKIKKELKKQEKREKKEKEKREKEEQEKEEKEEKEEKREKEEKEKYESRDRYRRDRHRRDDDKREHRNSNERKYGSSRWTEEERRKRLREMEMDGEIRDAQRWKRLKTVHEEESKETNKEGEENTHAAFIDDMVKKMYTM